jgi:hypothetical protein
MKTIFKIMFAVFALLGSAAVPNVAWGQSSDCDTPGYDRAYCIKAILLNQPCVGGTLNIRYTICHVLASGTTSVGEISISTSGN